jgi:hypothetical protein
MGGEDWEDFNAAISASLERAYQALVQVGRFPLVAFSCSFPLIHVPFFDDASLEHTLKDRVSSSALPHLHSGVGSPHLHIRRYSHWHGPQQRSVDAMQQDAAAEVRVPVDTRKYVDLTDKERPWQVAVVSGTEY